MNQLSMFGSETEKEIADCEFCRIIRGEVEAHIVFEDGISLAFLDRRPLFPGHCLLVPKIHFEIFSDLPENLIQPLFVNAQLLTSAVVDALGAEGSFVAMNNIVSQSVPHLHIHIVPRKKKDGLKGFFWPRNKYDSNEHIIEVQKAIQSSLRHAKGR